MSGHPVGRLAPSPTGAQHVGNARTFLLAWLSIRSRDGRLLLRIEDLDSPRTKRGAAAQALDDLRWLGLDWDAGPDRPGVEGPFVQTERSEDYRRALDELAAAERIYPCTCSRTDIADAASAPHWEHEGPRYPGTCAGRSASDARALEPGTFAWRFRTLPGEWSYRDRNDEWRSCRVADELGDFVVAKKDGTAAYQLAVVRDDHAMGVTEVVRGDDLLASTFRQLQLYRSFGWEPPTFRHVPLVVGDDGKRLAKRHGDTRLATYRELGVAPERLIGLLAWSLGLIDEERAITPRELLDRFDWQRVRATGPWVFGADEHRRLVG